MFYATILLSYERPHGREPLPNRRKGDWFHSVAVFANKSIPKMTNGSTQKCLVVHFFGENGGPVMEKSSMNITRDGTHKNKPVYVLSGYTGVYGFLGPVRSINGYIDVTGKFTKDFDRFLENVTEKWGNETIPYCHNRNESYNCVAFTDDVLYYCKYGVWNPRVVQNHEKYKLTV